MSKTYLMTGGTGFLGTLLSEELIKRGDKVIFLGRTKNGISIDDRIKDRLWNLDKNLNLTTIETFEVDMSKENLGLSENDTNNLKKMKIDGFWHLAAGLSFRSADREETFFTNTVGLKNVLNFIDKIDTTLLYVSTAYVHGKRKGALLENDFSKPKEGFNNPYEESKLEAERIIHEWSNKKEENNFIIFRPSILVDSKNKIVSVLGYYVLVKSIFDLKNSIFELYKKYTFLFNLIGISFKNNTLKSFIPFFYSKESHLNLMPVDIAIDWMVKISDNTNSNRKTFHLVNPKPFSMKQIIEQTFKSTKVKMPIIGVKRKIIINYLKIVRQLSRIITPLVGLSKKLHYYRFYMTENRMFDLSNTEKILGGDLKNQFEFEKDFIQKIADDFLNKHQQN